MSNSLLPGVDLSAPVSCEGDLFYFVTAKRGDAVVFAACLPAENMFLALELSRRQMIAKGIAARKDFSSCAVRFTHVGEMPIGFSRKEWAQ